MAKYIVAKQWRAVGACEYDVFHRDTKREAEAEDIVGEPTEVWAVLEVAPAKVVADCYTRADAKLVATALNLLPERWSIKS